ncbi:MAG: S8 family serine peptidase [Phaeodactylibacter sp.]|uniref:S8 family serine peptidase n=1 Tax=Phaeodactylibacter sp. TaxID=1940289 RepID=UPI0032EB4C22
MRQTLLLLCSLLLHVGLTAQDLHSGKVAPALQQALESRPDQYQTVQILLDDQVDIQALEARFKAKATPLKDRGQLMIDALQARASAVQPDFLARLSNLPGIRLNDARQFWIVNLVACDLNLEGAAAVSQLPGVAWMDINWEMAFPDACDSAPAPPSPNGIEPGLEIIGAPYMWKLGYTGYGRKVLVVDTGHDTDHPAIRANFAYQQLPMAQAWANGERPYFCGDHGTHVGGTITGIDRVARDTIGVAFGALWQGSSTSDCASSAGTALDALEISQWAIDPDGNPATITDRPDVINNSWSRDYPVQSDCGEPILRQMSDALYAVGIAVVFSASNEGPDALTIGDPPMENWDTVRMFSVGAVDGNTPNLPIASFSSRGPTVCGGEGSLLIKPEVSAPGVNVRSALSGGDYGTLSGTSMSAPHVSGALLLLKEAFPYLPGEALMLALYYSATDLGLPGEDNNYGMGLISLPAAYEYLIQKGHTPVPPVQSPNDVALLQIEHATYYCSNTISTRILVENNGTDTLNHLEMAYTIGEQSNLFNWEGLLLPKGRNWINLPVINIAAGEYVLDVEILLANQQNDLRSLDNRQKQAVTVIDNTPIPVSLQGNAPTCMGGSALLRAQFNEGTAAFRWFDQAEGGELLGEGPVLQLPNLQSNQDVYLEADITVQLETPEASASPMQESDAQEGLFFDASHPFTLKAVTVRATEVGGRMLRLTGPNETYQTKIIQIEEPGIHRIELNFEIPRGEGYKLMLFAGRPLQYTSSGAEFPVVAEQVMQITGATDSTGLYYYFYDWEINYDYFCERSAVSVPVSTTASAGSVDIMASDLEVDLATESGQVGFETPANGLDLVAWRWNFGNGVVSELSTPSYTYTKVGRYPVSVVVETAAGCTESAMLWVEVTDSTPPASTTEDVTNFNLTAFPNPVSENLLLLFKLPNSQDARIQLIDLLGRPLLQTERRVTDGVPIELQMATLPNGTYFVVVELEMGRMVRRVIKQ